MACAVEGHKNGVQPLLAHLLSESRIQVVGAKGHQINYQVTQTKYCLIPEGILGFIL